MQHYRIAALALTCFLALAAAPAQAMIKHIFIFEPPPGTSQDQYDVWYFRHHAPECVRLFGPWLKRYETFRAQQLTPTLLERFKPYTGRYTELWYSNIEDWKEAAPLQQPYTAPPWGWGAARRPTNVIIVPARPTEDFLRKEPRPEDRPVLRWVYLMKYPAGVSVEEGDRWYLGVHAEEAKKMPGLLRYVSYKGIKDTPIKTDWVRMTELWFKDVESFQKALDASATVKYTPAPWAKDGKPPIETSSTFIGYDPEVDFLRDRQKW